jgi:hypothetical protein
MEFSDNIIKLSKLLISSGKKLDIAKRQLDTFEKVHRENLDAFSKGIIAEKTFKKNKQRIEKERRSVEKEVKKIVQKAIKEILKLTE